MDDDDDLNRASLELSEKVVLQAVHSNADVETLVDAIAQIALAEVRALDGGPVEVSSVLVVAIGFLGVALQEFSTALRGSNG